MRESIAAGEAREDGRVTIEGRDAIRLVAGDNALVVDARTFEPIEWTSSVEGTGGMYDTATTRIEVYEWLPANDEHTALLSLAAQHPGATVVTDVTIEGVDGPKGQ
jgi:hypothetical protein